MNIREIPFPNSIKDRVPCSIEVHSLWRRVSHSNSTAPSLAGEAHIQEDPSLDRWSDVVFLARFKHKPRITANQRS
jgi:hypothetical protein